MSEFRISFTKKALQNTLQVKRDRKVAQKKIKAEEKDTVKFLDRITDTDIATAENLVNRMLIPTEEVKHLEELPGILISNFGRVFSIAHRGKRISVYEVKPEKMKYKVVFKYRDKKYPLDRAVTHLFIDNTFPLICPDIPMTDNTLISVHINNDKLDNRVENLKIVTQKERRQFETKNPEMYNPADNKVHSRPTRIEKNGKLVHHPLYDCWKNMPVRCTGKYPQWQHYKDAGVQVCQEWLDSYDVFYDWAIENGWALGLSIDRIDNDGNYCPENCRWVSPSENSRKMIKENEDVGFPKKACYSYNIHTKELKEYPSTKELEASIWNKSNGGYFSQAMKHHYLVKGTYYVGYEPEELKKLCED